MNFVGTPVYIDDNLTIYVREWEHQNCVENMSNKLTKWHQNRKRNPQKVWQIGDICAVKCRDGMFHRGKIKRICEEVCLVRIFIKANPGFENVAIVIKYHSLQVNLVDFGCDELVTFDFLSTHKIFYDVPIQVRKFRLFNTVTNSEEQMTAAVKFVYETIVGENCSFYIHDHFDPLHLDVITCNVRPLNEKLDLSTRLISNGLAQYGHILNKPIKYERDEEKRRRKQSEEPILKSSSELHSSNDFQTFYENNKVIVPVLSAQYQMDDARLDRTFEIFERPSRRCPLNEVTSTVEDLVVCDHPYPLIERITQHFTLLQLDEPIFYCRVLKVIDPITIAIVPNDTNPPPKIDVFDSQNKYFPMQGIHFLLSNWF